MFTTCQKNIHTNIFYSHKHLINPIHEDDLLISLWLFLFPPKNNFRKTLNYLLTEQEILRYITFIKTLSLSFSLLIIFMATFLPRTQWTPSLTRPKGFINLLFNFFTQRKFIKYYKILICFNSPKFHMSRIHNFDEDLLKKYLFGYLAALKY